MDADTFIQQAEAFVDAHGRRAWWQVMGDHGVDTLDGAVEKRDEIADTMRQLDQATNSR